MSGMILNKLFNIPNFFFFDLKLLCHKFTKVSSYFKYFKSYSQKVSKTKRRPSKIISLIENNFGTQPIKKYVWAPNRAAKLHANSKTTTKNYCIYLFCQKLQDMSVRTPKRRQTTTELNAIERKPTTRQSSYEGRRIVTHTLTAHWLPKKRTNIHILMYSHAFADNSHESQTLALEKARKSGERHWPVCLHGIWSRLTNK